MGTTMTSLWPDDIKIDVLRPATILKIQADGLARLTHDLVRAAVTTTTGYEDFVVHRLELIAPRLDDRRYGVLNATHRADFYPVLLEADCYRRIRRPRQPRPNSSAAQAAVLAHALGELAGAVADAANGPPPWPPDDWRPVAANQDEFVKLVGEVLRSREVRAVIESMIALSNEQSRDPDDAETPAA